MFNQGIFNTPRHGKPHQSPPHNPGPPPHKPSPPFNPGPPPIHHPIYPPVKPPVHPPKPPVVIPTPPVLRPPTPFVDYGNSPFVVNIEECTLNNDFYRQTLWTGTYLQLTLMSIPPGGDIGLEVHPDTDQFIRLEEGQGLVQIGSSRNQLNYVQTVFPNSAVFIPAGSWHNISNVGTGPMKLYSIYAPPHHPRGTIHTTKEAAEKMGD